jgi:hypothetical protein
MIALAAALLAAAPAAESPRRFVERLYAAYRDPDYSPLARPARIFAPALVAAIADDVRLSHDEVGFMDADPLCQCQDPAGLKAEIGAVTATGPGTATARLTLHLGKEATPLTLRLARTRSGWRIADVAAPGEPSLLQSLQAFNRRRAGGKR